MHTRLTTTVPSPWALHWTNILINTRLADHREQHNQHATRHTTSCQTRQMHHRLTSGRLNNNLIQGHTTGKKKSPPPLFFLDIQKALLHSCGGMGSCGNFGQHVSKAKCSGVLAQLCNSSSSIVSHRGCLSELFKQARDGNKATLLPPQCSRSISIPFEWRPGMRPPV